MTVNEYGRCNNETPHDRVTKLKEVVEYQNHIIEQYGKRLDAIEQHIQLTIPFDVDPTDNKCPTCELKFEGTMGYVCSRFDCPMQSKVSDFPFGLNTGG